MHKTMEGMVFSDQINYDPCTGTYEKDEQRNRQAIVEKCPLEVPAYYAVEPSAQAAAWTWDMKNVLKQAYAVFRMTTIP